MIELGLTDEWLEAVSYVEVGPDGERVDKKEYVTEWEKSVQSASTDDGILRKIKSGEALTTEQEKELSRRLNQPRHYFNEDNLRRAYRRPGGNLIDFVKAALGLTKLKTREEETAENFQAWLIAKNFSPQQASYLGLLKNRGVVRGKVEVADLSNPHFPSSTPPISESSFSENPDSARLSRTSTNRSFRRAAPDRDGNSTRQRPNPPTPAPGTGKAGDTG